MSDEKALLAAIWEHPHEDAPRLMYADWLEEHGGESETARAELVRTQVELARLDGDDPRYDGLEARATELLSTWEKRWWKAMPAGAKRGRFSRGFPVPNLGQFSVAGMVKLGETRLRAAPLWRYHYGVSNADFDALLAWPFLHRLELFALQPPRPDGWAERLAGCENARNVAELSLHSLVTAGELTLLLDAWTNRSLRKLNTDLNADGLHVLVNHPTAAKLNELWLDESGFTAADLRILTGSQKLAGLQALSLGYNRFGDPGLVELLRWPLLPKLRWLGIHNTGVTTDGVEALAACPAVSNLRTLWLSSNRIGVAGAMAVANSPHLMNLKRTSFYGTPAMLDRSAEAALRRRFGRGNY